MLGSSGVKGSIEMRQPKDQASTLPFFLLGSGLKSGCHDFGLKEFPRSQGALTAAGKVVELFGLKLRPEGAPHRLATSHGVVKSRQTKTIIHGTKAYFNQVLMRNR